MIKGGSFDLLGKQSEADPFSYINARPRIFLLPALKAQGQVLQCNTLMQDLTPMFWTLA
jgi:hypothetical protein